MNDLLINKMNAATNETNILQTINEIITAIENNDRNFLRRNHLDGGLRSIFDDYKRFANSLFEGTDLEFIPLYITTQLGIRHFNINRNHYQHYIAFIKNNQQPFKQLHEIIRKTYFNREQRDKNYYVERVKEILLAEASIERRRPLNSNLLVKSIYSRVYAFAYLPNVNEMYEFYLRNLPGNTIRTQARPIQRPTQDDNAIERLHRLPWKSKHKVNNFAKRNNWNDNELELARGQHLSDYFNMKNNLRYQLKAVAPRYTLIIDLFFPGRFVYLLAINVNTRKAFAIPSPLITLRSDNRYMVPQVGHKEVNNVIKMFQRLQQLTPIKMIVCDKEPAFLSREFKQLCLQSGITIHTYIKNDFKQITTTNDDKRGVHGLLSIMDRLCRTIRNMAYNVGVINQEIDPRMMSLIVNEYNNSPHTTFYKIFKKDITPNDMDNNPQLENKLCYQLTKQNFVIRNSKGYNISCPVRILNEASLFDKLKHKLLPGIFQIVGKDNNLFICKQGDTIIRVPRYMIRPA